MLPEEACVFVKFSFPTVYESGASISFHFQLHRSTLFSCHNAWRWITRNISVDHLTSVLFHDIDHDMIYSSRERALSTITWYKFLSTSLYMNIYEHICTSQIVSLYTISQQNVLSNNRRWWCYLEKVLNLFCIFLVLKSVAIVCKKI